MGLETSKFLTGNYCRHIQLLEALEETGQLDNTLIMFLADNGGCAEELGGGMRNPDIAPVTTRDGREVQRGGAAY